MASIGQDSLAMLLGSVEQEPRGAGWLLVQQILCYFIADSGLFLGIKTFVSENPK